MTRSAGLLLLLSVSSPCAAQSSVSHPEVVFQEGDVPPGGGGSAVVLLNAPVRDGAGKIGATGRLGGVPEQPFLWIDGQIEWLGADTGHPFVNRSCGFSSVAISPTSNPPEFVVTTGDAAVSHNGVILSMGDPPPGLPAGSFVESINFSRMDGSGAAYFRASARNPENKIRLFLYRSPSATAGDVDIVLAPGQEVGKGLTLSPNLGVSSRYDVSTNGLHHIHSAWVKGLTVSARSAVLINGQVELKWKDEAAGTGGKKWSRFDDVVINSHGDYLVQGVLHNQPSLQNDVLAYNGIVLVTEGDVIDGVPLAPPGYARDLGIADDGRIAFIWLTNGFAPEYLFVAFENTLSSAEFDPRLVLSAPSSIDTDGDGIDDAQIEQFSTYGESPLPIVGDSVYVQVELTPFGQSTRRAVLRVPL